MVNDLLTPIVNDRTVSVNFFNGRLLTGEDLTAEQKANRAAHALLGQAIGSGVAYGLEVSPSKTANTVQKPVLTVKQGVAINKNGAALLLDKDAEVSLVRPTNNNGSSASTVPVFQDCTPPQGGTYIAGAGVYLFTIGPASSTQGLAEVSGISTGSAPCSTRFRIDGVQFRLIQLDLTLAELGDVNHLQNLVAYKCFGVADWAANVTDPFGTPPAGYGLIDQLRAQQQVSNCEAPLAVLYWTADEGIVWVDMWAVRRMLVSRDLLDKWAPGASRRRLAEGLAMFLQFQEQVTNLLQFTPSINPPFIKATDYFQYLPAAGLLPIANISPGNGFDYLQFFGGRTYHRPVFMEGARLEKLIEASFMYPPISVTSEEMVWLYQIRENQQRFDTGTVNRPQVYMAFANGHLPFQADAHFDLNYWNYANFV